MFNFYLENSLKDANDLIQSYQLYKNSRPTEWQKFLKTLLKQSQISTEKQIVCDMIFQIVFSLILGDTKMTPFTIELTQLIHNMSLKAFNNSFQQIRTKHRLRQCAKNRYFIDQVVGHRVQVSSEITSTNIINDGVDNYDDNSNHGTILMLFQNQSHTGQSTEPQFSQSDNQQISRKLITILDCQKLVSCTKTKGRGIIPVDFQLLLLYPKENLQMIISSGFFLDGFFSPKETKNQTIPSFSSLKSILSETSMNITHITFTPYFHTQQLISMQSTLFQMYLSKNSRCLEL